MKILHGKYPVTKEQILCVAAGILLGIASFFAGDDGNPVKNVEGRTVIERPSAGSPAKEVSLIAEVGGTKEELSVRLSPRVYTEAEAEELFLSLMDALPQMMLGENERFSEITKDLSFVTEPPGFPGISCTYRSSDSTLITWEGKVKNSGISGPEPVSVEVTLAAGDYRRSYSVPMMVCPDGGTETEGEALIRLIAENDLSDPSSGAVELPSELNGQTVSYPGEKSGTPFLLSALGLFCAVLLGMKPKEEEKKRKKERETELLMDYSDVVSKLIVYIGAGLTIRNAWAKLSESEAGSGRAVYQEIAVTDAELKNGVPETTGFARFGKRCGLKCYIRLASLLDQNLKTGDSALLSALEVEMEEAFELRKNTARRLGEEAGTKLMMPLMMSLIAVLLIVMVPAVMKMM